MTPDDKDPKDFVAWVREITPARIGLPRAGDALSSKPVLEFRAAHAAARDAVYAGLDGAQLSEACHPLPCVEVTSQVQTREDFLRRPDFGRRLAFGEAEKLPEGPFDLVIVCADGLSANAVQANAPAFVAALRAALPDFEIAPLVIAHQGRVALSDEIGDCMQARLALILIGERPGLSVSDSMGAYLTYAPRPGRMDSERNCISNIHPRGLSPYAAADKCAWLIREALKLERTGIDLKDDQQAELPTEPPLTRITREQ